MKSPSPRQVQIQTQTELKALFQQQHEYKRTAYPEWATYDGDHRFDDRLTDLSHEAAEVRCQKNQQFLAQLQALDHSLLEPADLRNARLFAYMLDLDIRHHQLGLHLMDIDQQEGMHLKFPQLVEIQPLKTFPDYQQYFRRLQGFSKQVEDTIANLKLGISRQLLLPQQVVLESLKQMAELASCPLEQMPLFQPVLQNPGLSQELYQRVQELAQQTITERIQPAYQQLHDFVKASYLPACPVTVGLKALPNGEEIYAYWVERHTLPALDPKDIHALGLREVARLHQAVEPLRQQLGLPEDWQAMLNHLRSTPDYYYSDSADMMQDYQQMFDTSQGVLLDLFHSLPRTDCILKEMEPWRAAAAPQAYYYPPPQDLSRPGIYYVNTYDLPARPKYSMMALTLHEALPGHHLQLATALETPDLPDFRYHLEATAFVEGWALYAEALGHELGLYTDPLQALGALSLELWRACRLVVDTGLHALDWDRDQAIAYFREHTLQSETDIQSEIDRYLALPGQALAYKMGEQKILGWRQAAIAQQGKDFELKDFHEVLLRSGSLPLAELEQEMHDWLQA